MSNQKDKNSKDLCEDIKKSDISERKEAVECNLQQTIAPDGGYGWVIVAACFVLQGMLDGTFSLVGVFLPQFVDYFGEGRGQTAMIGSVMGGCVMLSGPFISTFVNCCGCRVVTMVGALIITFGMLSASLATNVNMLVITLGVVVGIGLGMIFLPSVVIVGFYFERRRAIASGIASAGAGVGVLILAPLAATLLRHYDWRGALIILAGVLLNSMVAGALLRPLVTPKLTTTFSQQSMSNETNGVASSDKYANRNNQTKSAVSETLLKAALLNSSQGQNGRVLNDQSNSKTNANGVSNARESLISKQLRQVRDTDRPRCISSSDSVHQNKRNTRIVSKGQGHNTHMHETKTDDNVRHYFSNVDLATDCSASQKLLAYEHHKHTHPTPLLQRKDIFYSGSITNLPEYRSQPDMQHYIASVTIPEVTNEESDDNKCCACVHKHDLDTMKRMLDFSLLTNPALLIIAAANALWQAGYMIPLLFVTDYGIAVGLDAQVSSLFIAVFGISMIAGRALGGALGNLPRVHPILVITAAQVFAGLAAAAVPFCGSAALVAVCMAVIGFMLGPITPLTTVCLVEWLGLNKLTNAVGLVSLSKGILCFFGAPIAGVFLDATGSYVAPFAFAGILYIGCGLLYALLPLIKKHSV